MVNWHMGWGKTDASRADTFSIFSSLVDTLRAEKGSELNESEIIEALKEAGTYVNIFNTYINENAETFLTESFPNLIQEPTEATLVELQVPTVENGVWKISPAAKIVDSKYYCKENSTVTVTASAAPGYMVDLDSVSFGTTPSGLSATNPRVFLDRNSQSVSFSVSLELSTTNHSINDTISFIELPDGVTAKEIVDAVNNGE